jgi:FKBP-type peptidyl-prolyl cis-trans isomerase FklB
MKYFWVIALCLVLVAGVATAADKPAATEQKPQAVTGQKAQVLKSQKAKDGYAIGYQIGEDFKRHNLTIDPDMLARGARDALAQAKPLMTPEERRGALTDLQARIKVAQQKMHQEQAAKNLAASDKFLAENGVKEGVKTLPSGLQYRVIQEGTGPSPKDSDTVKVNYRGSLIDGTEFDSSSRRGQPAELPVKGLIPGWTEALELMKTGSKWEIFIPPQLGYGERGAGAAIPPNSVLVFEVELLSVEAAKEKNEGQQPNQQQQGQEQGQQQSQQQSQKPGQQQ